MDAARATATPRPTIASGEWSVKRAAASRGDDLQNESTLRACLFATVLSCFPRGEAIGADGIQFRLSKIELARLREGDNYKSD
jgi:hypothetical protein